MPWLHRRIGNPVLTAILNLFFRTGLSDTHCGMRAFRREHLDALDLRTTGMEFASEQIIRASKLGLVFSEFPIPYRRRAGRSKLSSFADGWRHLRLLLAHSPKWAFVVPGGTLLALGLAISAVVIGDVSLFGRTWEFHALAAGALLTIAGSQVLQIGLFARVFAARYFGEPDPGVARLRVEQGILVGALLTLAGLGVCAFVVGSWVTSGLGSLGYENLSVVGVVLVVLGIQAFFGSLFVSVLELGGVHVRPGSTQPAHVTRRRVGRQRRARNLRLACSAAASRRSSSPRSSSARTTWRSGACSGATPDRARTSGATSSAGATTPIAAGCARRSARSRRRSTATTTSGRSTRSSAARTTRPDPGLRAVVDIGSNIGISALWFLTRNETSRCYLYEPVPANLERLRANLDGFEDRYELAEAAVADRAGTVSFGVEPTGRYGGVDLELDGSIEVDCLEINDVLAAILEREGRIDVLKLDTEGLELPTVQAIRPELLRRIDVIYFEWPEEPEVHPGLFDRSYANTTCALRATGRP